MQFKLWLRLSASYPRHSKEALPYATILGHWYDRELCRESDGAKTWLTECLHGEEGGHKGSTRAYLGVLLGAERDRVPAIECGRND
jgi:hypothetical protein